MIFYKKSLTWLISGDVNSPREYHKYWPEHDGLYDNILVKNISSADYDGFIVRQFKVGPVEVGYHIDIIH